MREASKGQAVAFEGGVQPLFYPLEIAYTDRMEDLNKVFNHSDNKLDSNEYNALQTTEIEI